MGDHNCLNNCTWPKQVGSKEVLRLIKICLFNYPNQCKNKPRLFSKYCSWHKNSDYQQLPNWQGEDNDENRNSKSLLL